jgi:hypothetical protein
VCARAVSDGIMEGQLSRWDGHAASMLAELTWPDLASEI